MTGHEQPDQLVNQATDTPAQPREVPDASRRYIALRYTLTATYHGSWSEAEASLAGLPAAQRAGIVDSQTGSTLASQAAYPAVEKAAGDEILGIMTREGPLGDLAGERGRRYRDGPFATPRDPS
ncbi:MAG: hypothetical protein GY719_06170 [bacterium]|nr:hypothetical protein [bacterium]